MLLTRFETEPYAFVLDHDRVRWLVTRADLQAPAVSIVVLAYLTVIEEGLKRLVPRELGPGWIEHLREKRKLAAFELYEQKRLANVDTGLEDCLFFTDWMVLARKARGLCQRLGFETVGEFDRGVRSFGELRNALAHGGTILDRADADQALSRVRRIRLFAERLWPEVDASDVIWDQYAATIIKRPRARVPLVGPAASPNWPFGGTVHVVTAWNPGSMHRPLDMNRAANREPHEILARRGASPIPVVCSSPDGSWVEHSLLVEGMSRHDMCEIGRMFSQAAVFEIDSTQLMVVQCGDAVDARSVPRVRAHVNNSQ